MKKTIKLASVLLRCGLGAGTADGRKKTTSNFISSPILLLCLLPVMYYLYRGGMILAELFGRLDKEGLMLGFFYPALFFVLESQPASTAFICLLI